MADAVGNAEEDAGQRGDRGTKEELGRHTSDSPPPRDVLCDFCEEKPDKALKSCLTCMVSYCEAHLRPHRINANFHHHRLVDPLHDVRRRTCQIHRLPLQRFCLRENCCICVECEIQRHKDHNTLSTGEAFTRMEKYLEKKKQQMNQRVLAAEKTMAKLLDKSVAEKSSMQEVLDKVEAQFYRLQAAVDEARKGAVEMLEGEGKQTIRQAESLRAHLGQRRTELKKSLAEIHKLSWSKTDVEFLQGFSEWNEGNANVYFPGVYMTCTDNLDSYVQVVTEATEEMCDLIRSCFSSKMSQVVSAVCKPQLQSAVPLPEPQTREDFLKYAKSLTFDPNTVHTFLRITDDNRKLINTSPWYHSYPAHPDRFQEWRQAMSLKSIYQGRHYIEAELSGDGAHVGITYKSIDRGGTESTSCITGNDFSWCIGKTSRGCFGWHAGVETFLEDSDITRVGLYVDFNRGDVSFYDVSGPFKFLHKYQGDFIEPLYVIIWLSKNENMVCLVDL